MSKEGSSFRQGISFGFRLGVEMLVATMVGALIGYGLDKLFGTEPWLLILFLLFGGAAGCLTVYRAAMLVQVDDEENNDDNNDSDDDDHKTSNNHPQSNRKL
ncbi:MAG: AtpZ/AtpI family protein [Nitrospinota bacterium]|jgi:ATP synthase protein I|nr:AtpZ/AtpI family protein [Nitrospinota bacterium]